MSKKLYKKLLNLIDCCSDVSITDKNDLSIGYGMNITKELTLIKLYDNNFIELQEVGTGNVLATITPDGEVLQAFKEILEELENIELLDLSDREIDLILDKLWINYIATLDVYGEGIQSESSLELFISAKRDWIKSCVQEIADYFKLTVFPDTPTEKELEKIADKIIRYAAYMEVNNENK